MKKRFKYDYNNRMFCIMLITTICCVIIAFLLFPVHILFAILFFALTTYCFYITFFVIAKQGVCINYDKQQVIIVDNLLRRKIDLRKISYVTFREIPKQKKNNVFGFLVDFFHSSTYMSGCDYVYNNGKVYNIVFHHYDGTITETYFGWLYREKNKIVVTKVNDELKSFIEEINKQATILNPSRWKK